VSDSLSRGDTSKERVRIVRSKSNSKSPFISFLFDRNRDFGKKKKPPTTSLIGYIDIILLYFGFLTSQRWRARLALYSTVYKSY